MRKYLDSKRRRVYNGAISLRNIGFAQAGPIGIVADGRIHKSPEGLLCLSVHDTEEMLPALIDLTDYDCYLPSFASFCKGPKIMNLL